MWAENNDVSGLFLMIFDFCSWFIIVQNWLLEHFDQKTRIKLRAVWRSKHRPENVSQMAPWRLRRLPARPLGRIADLRQDNAKFGRHRGLVAPLCETSSIVWRIDEGWWGRARGRGDDDMMIMRLTIMMIWSECLASQNLGVLDRNRLNLWWTFTQDRASFSQNSNTNVKQQHVVSWHWFGLIWIWLFFIFFPPRGASGYSNPCCFCFRFCWQSGSSKIACWTSLQGCLCVAWRRMANGWPKGIQGMIKSSEMKWLSQIRKYQCLFQQYHLKSAHFFKIQLTNTHSRKNCCDCWTRGNAIGTAYDCAPKRYRARGHSAKITEMFSHAVIGLQHVFYVFRQKTGKNGSNEQLGKTEVT